MNPLTRLILDRTILVQTIHNSIQITRTILANESQERLLYDKVIVPKMEEYLDKQVKTIFNDYDKSHKEHSSDSSKT